MTAKTLREVFDVARDYSLSELHCTVNGTYINAKFRVPEMSPAAVNLARDADGSLTKIDDETPEERDQVLFYSSG